MWRRSASDTTIRPDPPPLHECGVWLNYYTRCGKECGHRGDHEYRRGEDRIEWTPSASDTTIRPPNTHAAAPPAATSPPLPGIEPAGDGSRAGKIHHLKSWPEPFQAVRRGNKTHELRRNDRDYRVGDRIVLHEYDPDLVDEWDADGFTGARVEGTITYMSRPESTSAYAPGAIGAGYVILSVRWSP